MKSANGKLKLIVIFCFKSPLAIWTLMNEFYCYFGVLCSVRKRHREQRIAGTVQKIQEVKQRMLEAERKQSKWLYWRPILLIVGAGAAITAGLFTLWTLLLRWQAAQEKDYETIMAVLPGMKVIIIWCEKRIRWTLESFFCVFVLIILPDVVFLALCSS